MELKDGYKLTEVGVIPIDWEVKTISDISTPVRGGSPRPAGDPKYFNGNFIPWLTVASLTNIPDSQLYVTKTAGSLTKQGANYSRKLEIDTLIIANSGFSLGIAKILKIQCCANDGIAALLNFDSNTNKVFVTYYLNTLTKRLREVTAMGNDQPNLNKERIGNISIPFPPTIEEQTAIATALTEADALISGIEKLIAKKRDIKQGAMQKLLSPTEGWEVKKLGEIACFYKGRALPKSHLKENGKYKCIHYGELFTKYKELISNILSYTDENENVFFSVSNDVLMPTSDVTPNGLATASCIKEDGIILGGDILVIRLSQTVLDGVFFSYLISHNRDQVLKLVSGSTVYHLYGSDMKNLEFRMPSIVEQTRIATLLSDMDAEIAALEKKLEKYRSLKQGMMQQLLTGTIRLV